MAFVHLHNHSEYSLLDGANSISRLVSRAQEMGQQAVALTDHGVMYGAVEFYKKAVKAGVKPIIGCEVYVATGSRMDRNARVKDERSMNHLVLLAKDITGYQNLMRLVSLAWLEGYYYKPRVDVELLRQFSKGIIASSACLAGKVPQAIMAGDHSAARDAAIELVDIFGEGDFFLELQDHGIPVQKPTNDGMILLGKELGIPLVVTNDAHYPTRENARAHDVLLCIQTGSTLEDPKRLRFETDEFYLKEEAEMRALFPGLSEAFDNTCAIAERCDVELELGKFHLPKYDVPAGHDLDGYLAELCQKALPQRYRTDEKRQEVADRLAYELGVIKDMGFPGYFLVVWDFIQAAKDRGIAVGPGRGSAAGSIVAYLLGITNIDPLRYGLLFERFLNPSRKTMPDIDIDFDDARRSEIIDYVTEKYGQDHVAQIITFSKMKAKAATRDAGRVLGFPYGQVDKVARLVDSTIQESLEGAADLRKLVASDPEVSQIIEAARGIEGLARQDSIHAAGVVIAPRPITEYAPVQRKGTAETVTQYAMESITDIGLLKMDFLGLRTLGVLVNALDMIEKSRGVRLDLDDIPLDDEGVYRFLAKGQTVSVFQLESEGMRRLLRKMQPSCIEDLIALIALFRPGPLGSGMVDTFVACKRGEEKIVYPHPLAEGVLKETYGVIVYQEQVMQLASVLAGFTMAEADTLRKAISKKDIDVMATTRRQFVEGASTNGLTAEKAIEIFDLIDFFSGYGFNKSHSAAYAVLAFQTAYLKTYYPAELMAADLTSVSDEKDEVSKRIQDCNENGIDVLPPDVNASVSDFSVVGERSIRFGLGAIRNVGQGVIETIIEAREPGPFASFFDFCARVDLGAMNKRTIESLIKAGAFDSMGYTRKNLAEGFGAVVDAAIREKKEKESGQFNLFEDQDGDTDPSKTLESVAGPLLKSQTATVEYDKKQLLKAEKEMLGVYLTDHPLRGFDDALRSAAPESVGSLLEMTVDNAWIDLAGIISKVTAKATKKGDKQYSLVVEDLSGSIDVIVFASLAGKIADLLVADEVVHIRGRMDLSREDEVKVIAQSVTRLDVEAAPKSKALYLKLGPQASEDLLSGIFAILGRYPGDCPVVVDIDSGDATRRLRLTDKNYVEPVGDLVAELTEVLPWGAARVAFIRG